MFIDKINSYYIRIVKDYTMQYTLTQLTYAISLAKTGSFLEAADQCFVSQPTLSMQVKKLEDSLQVTLFDRSKHPIKLTDTGKIFIEKAKEILQATRALDEHIRFAKGEISGELRIGIIPTLAPFILPGFLSKFAAEYPKLKLSVVEMVTNEIVKKLAHDDLDLGILVTPLRNASIKEFPIFYEEILLYVNKNHPNSAETFWDLKSIDLNQIWMLSEGHCFRNQVLNLCAFKSNKASFNFESGSIETLIKMVDKEGGFTFIPELAALDLPPNFKGNIVGMGKEKQFREVSLVVSRLFVKERLVKVFMQALLEHLPKRVLNRDKTNVVEIEI
jgi:LysR family hydrogen peroxide-inducible transcriptional activator